MDESCSCTADSSQTLQRGPNSTGLAQPRHYSWPRHGETGGSIANSAAYMYLSNHSQIDARQVWMAAVREAQEQECSPGNNTPAGMASWLAAAWNSAMTRSKAAPPYSRSSPFSGIAAAPPTDGHFAARQHSHWIYCQYLHQPKTIFPLACASYLHQPRLRLT